MEKVATDIYSFDRLREEGFTYVDKTKELYAMASGDVGVQFFMARPRRFGKSVMISTFHALFEARKELFENLAIEKEGWEWEKYPVMHFDLGLASAASAERFEKNFDKVKKIYYQKNTRGFMSATMFMTLSMKVENVKRRVWKFQICCLL